MELTCFLDYCLACDKQTAGETYCSQACRLADLETSSTWSGTASPSTSRPSPSWASSHSNQGSGFYLSPAINFAAYKSPITSTYHTTSQPTSPLSSYFPKHTSSQLAATKTLSPSSSRSSLSSTSSISSRTDPLSEQARTELRGYTDAFDSTRNWRRRMTWS
ncbi:hypothetical protein P7C71_g4558, partial [Lecanoromycetidae sp. Uapishka_2]